MNDALLILGIAGWLMCGILMANIICDNIDSRVMRVIVRPLVILAWPLIAIIVGIALAIGWFLS